MKLIESDLKNTKVMPEKIHSLTLTKGSYRLSYKAGLPENGLLETSVLLHDPSQTKIASSVNMAQPVLKGDTDYLLLFVEGKSTTVSVVIRAASTKALNKAQVELRRIENPRSSPVSLPGRALPLLEKGDQYLPILGAGYSDAVFTPAPDVLAWLANPSLLKPLSGLCLNWVVDKPDRPAGINVQIELIYKKSNVSKAIKGSIGKALVVPVDSVITGIKMALLGAASARYELRWQSVFSDVGYSARLSSGAQSLGASLISLRFAVVERKKGAIKRFGPVKSHNDI